MPLSDFRAPLRLACQRYATENDIAVSDDWLLLKLAEEAGEVAQAYVRLTRRARQKPEDAQARQALGRELADLIGFSILVGDRYDLDLDAALATSWDLQEQ